MTSPLATLLLTSVLAAAPADRPNVLWITCEDISPNLGCFGDPDAVTPNLDRLAQSSVRYTSCFAPIGVCAPSRSCLITGMYPPALGTQHMRCQGMLPPGIFCYPQYLREQGYYCTNNAKTDYNFPHPQATWDECSAKGHWRNRKAGQPFFSIFNILTTHEGQIRLPEAKYRERIRSLSPAEIHDPARIAIPPYHPDAPEVRRDWARYADLITLMDREAGKILADLAADGLADNTIVFFYSDHGAGMPRSKRWLYESSTRVPLIIHFPPKWRHLAPTTPGGTVDQLVSFVDFAPTLLSLCQVPVPPTMQGQAFLGTQQKPAREYVFGYRDRMDERYDLMRSTRDRRYRYIRNFRPDLPYFHQQHISYLYEMPTMQVWQRWADAGQLKGPSAIFMARNKPFEELYDVQADPHEIDNLAGRPELQATLERLRTECRRWQREILDLGLLPESDLRTRFGDESPYQAVRRDPTLYPFERIAAAADLAGRREPGDIGQLIGLLADRDPAVRYWAAVGLGAQGPAAAKALDPLEKTLGDTAPAVRIAAAIALQRLGRVSAALPVLRAELRHASPWVRLQAANGLDFSGDRSPETRRAWQAASQDTNEYVSRVAQTALKKP